MKRLMAVLQVPLLVVACCLVIVGVCHIAAECHSSWYEDGGVFYEDDGTEVIFSPNPIRVGDVLLSWDGPSWIAVGLGLIYGLWKPECRRKVTDA
jgi:hypothetical protein